MNNTFSFSRFGRFFLYDFKRWAVSYGPSFLMMSLMPAVLYAIMLVTGLVFSQDWSSPEIASRTAVFAIVTSLLLITYPSNVYGFLTDRQSGSAYLMIPASVGEKFASMMANVLLAVPVIFFSVYLSVDALICAIDSNCGPSLFASAGNAIDFLLHFGDSLGDGPAAMSVNLFWLYLNFCIAILYFLLCAVLFKKHKLLYPILIIIGLNFMITLIAGFVFTTFSFDGEFIRSIAYKIINEWNVGTSVTVYNILCTLINLLATGGLAVAVYFRVKTIKH
ncbi:MAG: hypothetical protein ACI3ZT_10725 [Candidatus Cryptobacteroides sp.]